MKFIFQDSFLPDEREKLIPILKEKGIPYSILNTIYEADLIGGETVVVRGSIEFYKSFHNLFGEYVNIYEITWGNYLWSKYIQHFNQEHVLNNVYTMWPWHSLSNPHLFSTFLRNHSDHIFIKPNDGEKSFTGTTLRAKWWEKELEAIKSLPGNEGIKDDTLVVMSDFKNIAYEARCIMYKNTMIDFSFYTKRMGVGIHLMHFLFSELNLKWCPDTFWTLDIAFLNHIPYVLEINSAWCAGWYYCDYELIVNKILESENESN